MNPRMRTIKRAVEALGGEHRLAKALGVQREEVTRWLSGESHVSDAAYFAALDIVANGSANDRKSRKDE